MSGLDITLLRPLWLLALVPVTISAFWLLRRPGRLGAWEDVADPGLLTALRLLGRVEGGVDRVPVFSALAVTVLGVLALSGPAVERREALSFRNLDGVVFVMDASRSATEHARWPQIVTMGRYAIAALGTRPAGLIVYAGDSYVATDMTADVVQLGQTLSLIDASTVPDPGSRPGRAIRQASDMLRNADILAGDVILFTDGAGLGQNSLQGVATLAGQGARISFVGIEGASPALETHASIGGGQVFTLDQTDDLAAWLQNDARTRLEQQDYPLLFWTDLGRYLIGLSLLPMLLLFRRVA